MYEMSQRHPVWVAENHVNPCNSVAAGPTTVAFGWWEESREKLDTQAARQVAQEWIAVCRGTRGWEAG
jgi:hypothetical protein